MYGTFTKKQIGVIYAANKRGDVMISDKEIKNLYNFYVDLSPMMANDKYNRRRIFCDSISNAIELIIANNFKEAQEFIDRAEKF